MKQISMLKLSLGLALSLGLTALPGCSGPLLDAGGKIAAAGGKTAPAEAVVDCVWVVSSGSPDYSYAFGSGEATADSFTLSFEEDPPAEALNSYGIGVGVLALMPTGKGLAQGKLDDKLSDTLEDTALGAAGGYAIIFKKAGAADGPAWAGDFPDGYSCAKGVPATGDGFDTFAPVDCAEVVITVDDINNIEFTNWT